MSHGAFTAGSETFVTQQLTHSSAIATTSPTTSLIARPLEPMVPLRRGELNPRAQ